MNNDPSTTPQKPSDQNASLEKDTAHVLFLDIVGFSKLYIPDQKDILYKLQEVVRNVPEFKRFLVEKDDRLVLPPEGKLIARATGDGMALAFFTPTCENAVKCALEITKSIKKGAYAIPLRMGVHSGTVVRIRDINNEANIAGGGINMAQRVMDYGDENHILLSDHVATAECLSEDKDWKDFVSADKRFEATVKHGIRVNLYSLFMEDEGIVIGKEELPQKLLDERKKLSDERRQKKLLKIFILATALILIFALSILAFYLIYPVFFARRVVSRVAVIPRVKSSVTSVEKHTLHIANKIQGAINGRPDPNNEDFPSSLILSNLQGSSIAAPQEVDAKVIIYVEGEGDENNSIITVTLTDRRTGHTYDNSQITIGANDRFEKYDKIVNEAVNIYSLLPTDEENKILAANKPSNVAAKDDYLNGLLFYLRRNPGELQEALRLFNEALAKDPDFGLAHMKLADCYTAMIGVAVRPRDDLIKKAEQEAQKAIELLKDESVQTAYSSKAFVHFWLSREYDKARDEFVAAGADQTEEAAIKFRYGIFLVSSSQRDAIGLLSTALEKAPKSRQQRFIAALGQVYYFSGNFPEVIKRLDASKDGIITSNRFLAMAYEQTGKYDFASRILSNLIEAEFKKGGFAFKEADTISFNVKRANDLYDYQDSFAALAHVYAVDGRKEDKEKALKMVKDLSTNKTKEDERDPVTNQQNGKYISAYNIALIYAGLGDNDNAFKYLDMARSENDVRLAWLPVEPRFKELRSQRNGRQWMESNYPHEVVRMAIERDAVKR
jgi:class 3 adenylate cyclase/tetratricopeptide (TPR) repeat protein